MSVFAKKQVYALGSLLKISYFQIVPLLSNDMIFQIVSLTPTVFPKSLKKLES